MTSDYKQRVTDNLCSAADTHSQKMSELSTQLSDRQADVCSLFSTKLRKDVATGATPNRQDYSYPRNLTATSPHERLLKRYRTTSSTRHTARVPLPLPTEDEVCLISYQLMHCFHKYVHPKIF